MVSNARPAASEKGVIVLQIVSHLGFAGIGQGTTQGFDDRFQRQLRSGLGSDVPDGNVIPLFGLGGERYSDEIGLHLICAGRFDVESNAFSRFEALDQIFEFFSIVDDVYGPGSCATALLIADEKTHLVFAAFFVDLDAVE
jgi:hypothetical protein